MPVLVVMKCDKLGRSHVFVCIAAPNSFGKTKLIYELLCFLPKVKNDLCYRDFNTGLSPLTNVDLTRQSARPHSFHAMPFLPCLLEGVNRYKAEPQHSQWQRICPTTFLQSHCKWSLFLLSTNWSSPQTQN